MRTSARTIHTWFLAALFAAAVGVGEAWHLVPGNGHLVRLPGGCLSVGIALPQPLLHWQDGYPVVDDGRLTGIVSVGDCVKAIVSKQEFIIEQLENYIRGG